MRTVYSLHRIEVKKNQRYPKRKLDWHFIGYFSSLEEAHKAIMEIVAQKTGEDGNSNQETDRTLCYKVDRVCLDMGIYEHVISWHIYTRKGESYEECFMCDENDPKKDIPFYGRPEEKIRFKVGDIVEVVCGRDCSELGIVVATPYTPERYKEFEERCIKSDKSCLNRVLLDYIDDCYMTYSLGIGDTHDHPIAIFVFAPTKKVPANLARKLRAKLIAEDFASLGGDVPIRWGLSWSHISKTPSCWTKY